MNSASRWARSPRRFLTKGREQEPDLARTNMDHAAEVVLRAGRIIQRLREFVAGGQPERHPENIADLIDDAGLLALVGTAALDIAVARHIEPSLPLALVDRTQIQQVLVNLIRNAIEAMQDVEQRELRIATAAQQNEMVEISVSDSGPGIAPEVASQLFHPFVTTKPQGMGVGLSISRTIIEAHGGRLWADPNPDGGTIFRLTLRALNKEELSDGV
jgi:two-component system sensor kinase FixL